MSSRMDHSMPVTAVACTHRRYRFSKACVTPSPAAARLSGSRPREFPCAMGPSITALVSSGIVIWAPTAAIAAASISASRHACGRRYVLVRHNAANGASRAGRSWVAAWGSAAGSGGIPPTLTSRPATCHLNFGWPAPRWAPARPPPAVAPGGLATIGSAAQLRMSGGRWHSGAETAEREQGS